MKCYGHLSVTCLIFVLKLTLIFFVALSHISVACVMIPMAHNLHNSGSHYRWFALTRTTISVARIIAILMAVTFLVYIFVMTQESITIYHLYDSIWGVYNCIIRSMISVIIMLTFVIWDLCWYETYLWDAKPLMIQRLHLCWYEVTSIHEVMWCE